MIGRLTILFYVQQNRISAVQWLRQCVSPLQNRKAYLRSKITRLDEAGVAELPDGRSNTKTVSRVDLQAEVDALDAVQRRGRPVSAHLLNRQNGTNHLKMTTAAKAIAKQEAQAAQTTGALTTNPPPPTVKRWGGAALSKDAKDKVVLYQLYFKLMAHISYQQWTESRMYFPSINSQWVPEGQLNKKAIRMRAHYDIQFGTSALTDTAKNACPAAALAALCLKAGMADPQFVSAGNTTPLEWKLSADGLQLACFSFTAAAVCLLNTALATQARSNYLPTFLSWDSEKDAYSSDDFIAMCQGVKTVENEGITFYWPPCKLHPVRPDYEDCDDCKGRLPIHKVCKLKVTADWSTLLSLQYGQGWSFTDSLLFCPDCDCPLDQCAKCVFLGGEEDAWHSWQKAKTTPFSLFGIPNVEIIICFLHCLIRINSRLLSLMCFDLYNTMTWTFDAEFAATGSNHKPDGKKKGGDALIAEFVRRVGLKTKNFNFNIVNKGANWFKPDSLRGDHGLKILVVVPEVLAELLPPGKDVSEMTAVWTLWFQIVFIAGHMPEEHLPFFTDSTTEDPNGRSCRLQASLDQLALLVKQRYCFKRGNNKDDMAQINLYMREFCFAFKNAQPRSCFSFHLTVCKPQPPPPPPISLIRLDYMPSRF